MPVTLTNKDIGTRYALQEDFNNGFVGRDRQVVIQTDDPKGYRPVIMDGKTTGGKSKVALLDDLEDYAPKSAVTNLQSELNTKANVTHTHSMDDVNDVRASIEGRVKSIGDRGQLAGYESNLTVFTTINQNTDDSGFVFNNVTISNGTNNTSWIKVFKIESDTLSVTLKDAWAWANGEAPEINQYDFLVCAWIVNVGIATVVKRSA